MKKSILLLTLLFCAACATSPSNQQIDLSPESKVLTDDEGHDLLPNLAEEPTPAPPPPLEVPYYELKDAPKLSTESKSTPKTPSNSLAKSSSFKKTSAKSKMKKKKIAKKKTSRKTIARKKKTSKYYSKL